MLLRIPLLLALSASCLHGACQIRENPDKTWLLENDLISARLRPLARGTIDDLQLKSAPLPTLLPYRETREEIFPGTGVFKSSKAPSSGCRDAFWRGIDTFKGPYSLKVLEQTPDTVRVVMAIETDDWRAERELSLADHQSSLGLTVRLTAKNTKANRQAYWFQSYLRLADTLLSMPGDDSELLIAPVRQESRAIQGLTQPRAASEIVKKNPGDTKSWFVPPAQPWCAAIDRPEKLIFAVTPQLPNFPDNLIFYSWSSPDVYSMEMIFPVTEYAVDKPVEHQLRLTVVRGLSDVTYATENYLLYLEKPAQLSKGSAIKLAVLSPKANYACPLKLLLRQSDKEIPLATTDLKGLQPDKPVFASTTLPSDLAPGTYELWVDDGHSRSQLIGQDLAVQ